jgi:hypothetical protein
MHAQCNIHHTGDLLCNGHKDNYNYISAQQDANTKVKKKWNVVQAAWTEGTREDRKEYQRLYEIR